MQATQAGAVAVGLNAAATGTNAIAIGPGVSATLANSSAIGAERNRRQSDGVHWETHHGIASNGGADGTLVLRSARRLFR